MSDETQTQEEQAPAQVAEQAAPAAPAEEPAAAPEEQAAAAPEPEQQAPLQEGDEVAWTAAGLGMLVQVEQRGGVDVGLVLAGQNWCWHPDGYFTSEATEAPGVPIRLADLRRPAADAPADEYAADERDAARGRIAELEQANEELRARVEELEDELGQDEEADDEDEDGKPVRRQLPPVKNFEGRLKRIKRFTRRAMGFAKDAAADLSSVSTELIGPGARESQIAYHNGNWDELSATLRNAKDNIEGVSKDAKDAGKALKLVVEQSEHFLQQAIDVHYHDVLTGQRNGNGKQTTIDEAVGGRHRDTVKPAPPKHETAATPAEGQAAQQAPEGAGAAGAAEGASEGGDAPAPAGSEQAAAPAPQLSEAQRAKGQKWGLTVQQLDAIDAALRADPKISQVQLSKVTGVERTKVQRLLKAGEG